MTQQNGRNKTSYQLPSGILTVVITGIFTIIVASITGIIAHNTAIDSVLIPIHSTETKEAQITPSIQIPIIETKIVTSVTTQIITEIVTPTNSIITVTPAEPDIIKSIVKSYFDLLSDKEIDLAFNTYLDPKFQEAIINNNKVGLSGYRYYWSKIDKIEILDFGILKYFANRKTCYIEVLAAYYSTNRNNVSVPSNFIDTIYFTNYSEKGWLISNFQEQKS